MNSLKRLWELIVLDKKEVVSIYFYAVLSGLLQLSVPIGIQSIVSFVLGASMVTSIYILIVLVVIGVFSVGMMQINQMKIIEKIQQRIFTRNAYDFAEKVPRFDLYKMDNFYLPERVNYFFDTVNVQKGISKLLLDVPAASIQIIFGLLLLSLYHPIFIVFGLLLVVILWLILKMTATSGLASSLKESTYKYAVLEWLTEIARVIKSFKFSQGTHLNLKKTDERVSGYLGARTTHFKVLLFQYQTLVVFKVAITTVMLTAGTYLLVNQQLNIGEFIAAEIVIFTVIGAVEKLIGSLESVYDVVTGLEKLAIISESPLEKEGDVELDSRGEGLDINFKEFSFSYPNGKKVLRDFNFQIKPNSKVCVSTQEGSGKSTLLKVLSGNYADFEGSLLINKLPINSYQLESFRTQVGIFLNQQDIFSGTVWENIAMGREEIKQEDVMDMAEGLGIAQFLNQLSSGFNTQLDPSGKKMPSTLVKYILLLRAFANQPKLVLLEDPWEGLEPEVQLQIKQYLLNKLPHTTLILTTQDEDFARKCDAQIVLTNGSANFVTTK